MLLGIAADSAIRAGLAEPCTEEEALDALAEGRANGLTQLGTSLDGTTPISRICTACSCACTILKAVNALEDTAHAIRAAYRADIDADRCAACGACVQGCATNALALGLRAGAGVGTSPCFAECPAHIPVQSILQDLAAGETEQASHRLLRANALPGVTGAVCDRPCEWFCSRRFAGGALNIGGVEATLAESAAFSAPKPQRNGRVAVIGSGPAGLSCAAVLAVDGYSVTIFEKEALPGGALRYGIGTDRLPPEILEREIARIETLGVNILTGVVFGRDITLSALREEGYGAICLAAGASGSAPLKLDGADLPGVLPARDWLRDAAQGEVREVHGDVVVLGGGRVALQCARTAKLLGAERVVMAARRSKLHPSLLEQAEALGVEIRIPAAPAAIQGSERAERVTLDRMALVTDDGKSKLQRTGEQETVSAALVLNAQQARVDWSSGMPEGVECNRNGTLIVDGFSGQTALADVFAAGDAVTGTRSVIEAIAAGQAVGASIARYLSGAQDLRRGADGAAIPAATENAQQIIASTLTSVPRIDTLKPDSLCAEAARCPSCGSVTFDNVKCIGCGNCAAVCRYDAIRMRVML